MLGVGKGGKFDGWGFVGGIMLMFIAVLMAGSKRYDQMSIRDSDIKSSCDF